jgi:hypothetical protein
VPSWIAAQGPRPPADPPVEEVLALVPEVPPVDVPPTVVPPVLVPATVVPAVEVPLTVVPPVLVPAIVVPPVDVPPTVVPPVDFPPTVVPPVVGPLATDPPVTVPLDPLPVLEPLPPAFALLLVPAVPVAVFPAVLAVVVPEPVDVAPLPAVVVGLPVLPEVLRVLPAAVVPFDAVDSPVEPFPVAELFSPVVPVDETVPVLLTEEVEMLLAEDERVLELVEALVEPDPFPPALPLLAEEELEDGVEPVEGLVVADDEAAVLAFDVDPPVAPVVAVLAAAAVVVEPPFPLLHPAPAASTTPTIKPLIERIASLLQTPNRGRD